jgi:dynein heavy chain
MHLQAFRSSAFILTFVLFAGIGAKQPLAAALQEAERAVREGEDIRVIGKNYFRNPEVNRGFYSKKREGVADPDPKVMEPYVPIPGKPPRKVVIDRQRKLFAALDIEELLLELGIDYRNPEPNQADWLPLEPFDDLEYDCRLPGEWLELGRDDDGNEAPVPAQGLHKNDDGSCEWRPVLIRGWDEERAVYTGVWDETGVYVELTRINLLFNSEDPRIFAQRVAQAHQERIYADSQIRYNFFIDNMPTEELSELDPEQISRIISMATASRYLKSRGSVDTTAIMFEVNQDFARTMNKIIMEKTLEKSPEELQDMIPANLQLPEKPPSRETPYFGMVPIPQHDFPEQFSNFCFKSLYIKEEAIGAMVSIRTECNQLLAEHRLFNVEGNKTMRVEEFKQLQASKTAQVSHATGEQGWVGKLALIIKNEFAGVGKGWFNIQESSKETYEFGKLKKFLTLVNFMMQDAVLTMCKSSVAEFVEYVLSFCPKDTEIISTREVKNTFDKRILGPEDSDYEDKPYQEVQEEERDDWQNTAIWLHEMFDKNKDPEPLFVLDLILKPGQLIPTYSTQPKEVVEKLLEVFDAGIECLQQIPQLEPVLLSRLFKTPGKKMLKAPLRPRQKPNPVDPNKKSVLPDENTWLWEAYDALQVALSRAIKPLHDYVETFAQFKKENELSPDKYVQKLDGEGPEGGEPADAEALRADIYRLRELEAELRERIPESVTVSIFTINIKDIRNLYTGKYQQIVEKEVKLMASRAKGACYEISTKFGEITDRIRREPKNIEELTDTRKYISDVGIEIEKLKREIEACMRTYDIAGEFHHEFSAGENEDKWQMFGAPQKVLEAIEAQSQILEKTKEAFIRAMEQEQEEFEETMEQLAQTVDAFASYDDLNKYQENAQYVESVSERLADCQEKARLFSTREALVGKEPRDYSRLKDLEKEFRPYSTLWLTTRTWFARHEAWTAGAWEELDPEELDMTFEKCLKDISWVARYFKDKPFPKITEDALAMKAQVDAFKPVVPLALSLRKAGMRERHWDQLTTAVGFDVRPPDEPQTNEDGTPAFTLTSLVDLGMLKHVDAAEEVGERAFKEHHIETSLRKMKAAWAGVNFTLPTFKNTGTSFISGFEDAIQMLDEHIVTA